jgi:hypothetical protein
VTAAGAHGFAKATLLVIGLMVLTAEGGLTVAQTEAPPAQRKPESSEPKQNKAHPSATRSQTVPDDFARFVAFLSLLVAIGALAYTVSKDRKTRHRSVEDEFWLRSVLGPVVIEPLIETVLELCKSLPEDASKYREDVRRDIYDDFLREYKTRHQETISKLMLLGLISATLYKDCSRAFDEIEDIVTEHCGANRMSLDPKLYKQQKYAAREPAVNAVHSKLREILERIKRRQHAL